MFAAVRETHVGEISVPVTAYVTQRVAALKLIATPTKAEKAELKLLTGLAKSLAKTSLALKQDFAELKAAGAAFDKVGATAAMMQPSVDEGFVRANLSLSERVELVGDYLAVLTNTKHRAAVAKSLLAVTAARSSAASALTAGKRAGFLAKADAAVSATLKKADKYVLADFDVNAVPPTRYRSGDSVPTGGGRVAIPRDSASPIAGASVVIPKDDIPAALAVTLEPAPSFVGGRDLPAGPAIAVGPGGTQFPIGVTIHVPYVLPDGANATDLVLAAKGPPATNVLAVVPGSDGTMAASVTKFDTFQASIPAPPLGQPGGPYHLQMFIVNTVPDAGDVENPPADLGGVLAAFEDRTVTFRADHTGSMSTPSFPGFSRTFTGDLPHHLDLDATPLDGSVELTWTSGGSGRFSMHFNLATRAADALGIVSEDGRVLAFSGRGTSFEFLAVGVRGVTDAVTADLAGRWAAVEMGVQFRDDAAEPFTTRWFDAFRTLTATTAGVVTFDAAGTRFESDVTYDTTQADPVHTRAENVVPDSGAESWTLNATGRISNSLGNRAGWFDRTSGVLTTSTYDAAARRVSFMIAVRQAATAATELLPGVFQLAQLDVGTTVGTPATHGSAHDVTAAAGSLDVQSVTAATLALEAATRSVHTLDGPATGTHIAWTLTSASSALPAASTPLTLALDAAGNHREPADERWFAFSADGRIVLGLTRGEPTRLARGIAIGVK